LNDPLTVIEGAELVLGRRVDAGEEVTRQIITLPISAEDKFALLLLQTTIEEMQRRRGKRR